MHIGWLFSSCGKPTKTHDKKLFRLNLNNGISSLDPAFARTQDNIWAVNQLYNGLVQLDRDLNLKACIADSWSIDSNGTIYDFYLRHDVFFHPHPLFDQNKRRQLNAYDVAYSYQRLIEPSIASPGAWVFRNRVKEGGFEVVDSFQLRIHLEEAFSPFIYLLSMPYTYIVPPEVADHYGKGFGRHPVGTGPFLFYNWKEGVKLNLHKNGNYFEKDEKGQSLPYLDAVSIGFIPSKQAEFLEFLQGKLEMFNGLESSIKDQVIDRNAELKTQLRDRFNLEITEFLNTEFLGIHSFGQQAHPGLSKPKFREALSLAIDRKKMIQYLRNGLGQWNIDGFTPASLRPLKGKTYAYDSEAARQLIDSIGAADFPPMHLSTTADYLDLMIFIQASWQAVGIETEIEVLPASILKDEKNQGNLDLFRSSWIADYPDMENYLSCFYGPNSAPAGPNYSRFQNPDFDRAYQKLNKASDEREKAAIGLHMEEILHKEFPVIPLFYDQSVRIYPKHVRSPGNNPLNSLFLKEFDLTTAH